MCSHAYAMPIPGLSSGRGNSSMHGKFARVGRTGRGVPASRAVRITVAALVTFISIGTTVAARAQTVNDDSFPNESFSRTPLTLDVLENDIPGEGGSLTVRQLIYPAKGCYPAYGCQKITTLTGATVAIASDGAAIEYSMPASFFADNPAFVDDSFDYGVTDGREFTATVSVRVVNQPPKANNDQARTNVGESVAIDVLQNDVDPEGNAFYVYDATEPAHGVVQLPGDDGEDRNVLYTPDDGFIGTDTFSYSITNALEQTSTATVTVIVEGPSVSISDETVNEGADGGTISFEVSLSRAAALPVRVSYATTDGNATAGSDYTAAASTITIPADRTTGTITIPIVDDTIDEANETFTVTLSSPVNAILGNAVRATGTIEDDDVTPTVSVEDTTTTEDVGTLAFTVRLSAVSATDVTVEYTTADGTAISGGDYTTTTGTATILAGQATSTISIPIVDDNANEVSETFTVALSSPVNAELAEGSSRATITISDDDEAPAISIDDSSTEEGKGPVVFTVRLSSVSAQDVSAHYESADGTANAGLDYTATSGTITIPAGQTSNTITVAVAADTADEPGEAFTMALSSPTNATLGAQASATGTINDETADFSALLEQLEDLPENLKGAGQTTIRVCKALESAGPSGLTEGQRNMLASCNAIAKSAAANPDQTRDAVEQLSGQQNISRVPVALAFGTTQLTNVNTRLLELRRGASGVSTTGLTLSSPGLAAPPVSALASLGEILFGEGGGSGDDEGSLLSERLGVFLNGAVRFGDKDETSRETGFSFDTQGLTAGVDYRFSDTLVGGAAIGYGKASADFDHDRGSQDADNYAGSLYATWYSERGYLDGIVGFGKVSYDTLRKIDLYDGSVLDRITGDTDGDQWTVGLSAGYEWLKGGARIGPDFSLNYVSVSVDAFQETDQGSGLALDFGSQSGDSLTLRAGGHIFYSLSQTWAVLSPYARLNVVKEFLGDPDKISIRFANDPITIGPGSVGGDFILLTDEPDEYYFEWAVGLTTDFKGGVSGFIDYESVQGLNAVSMGLVTIGIRYQTSFR